MIQPFESVVIRTFSRVITPFLQVFGLYVIAHGHVSPGGGFQGGCILAASFILVVIAYDITAIKRLLSETMNTLLAGLGVLLFAGIGLLCIALGANYLDYGALHRVLLVDPVTARMLGSLGIEIAVGLTVTSVMLSIFLNIASGGTHGEGGAAE